MTSPRKQIDTRRYYIDNSFIRDGYGAELGPYAIAVYNAIAVHANQEQEAWPSHGTIAKLTGMSARQVMREIEALAEYNIISVISRAEERKPAIITLLDRTEWKPLEHMTDSQMVSSEKQEEPPQPVNGHMTPCHMSYDKESYEHMTGSHTNRTNKTELNNNNGDEKKSPPKKKARSPTKYNLAVGELGQEFTRVTGIKEPGRKSDKKFWFSSLGEIYRIAEKDVDIGKKLIEYSVSKLREGKLTVSDPNSIIKTARDVMAKRAEQKMQTTKPVTTTIANNGGAYLG